jgi:hypothetical protein
MAMSNVEKEHPVKEAADRAYNAVKEILFELPDNVTAPTVYSITGNLKLVTGSYMTSLFTSMAEGLSRSLIDFDNYVDDGSNPADAVATANAHLNRAIALAAQLGEELSDAQVAIRSVGYREPGDIGYRKPEDRK